MKYKLVTDYPIAYDSPDHQIPHGTKWDNSTNPAFNAKLYQFLRDRAAHPYWVLDLGCSGGGFVKTLVDDGHEAIGLEGSDYSLKLKRAEWGTIPDHLFTCDVTKPFMLCCSFQNDLASQAEFDAITAWELMEHIPEDRLGGLAENVLGHLAPHGIFICSVSPNHDGPWHVCVKPKGWWEGRFAELGFKSVPGGVAHFGDDWIRGPSQGAPGSFHFVLEGA